MLTELGEKMSRTPHVIGRPLAMAVLPGVIKLQRFTRSGHGGPEQEVAGIRRRLEMRYHIAETDWRMALRWWLEQSRTGRLFEMTHSMLSVLSVVLYVALTYEDARDGSEPYDIYTLSELVFVCIFFLDYVLRLLAFGMRYALSLAGVVDLITTVPALIPVIADLNSLDLDLEGQEGMSSSNAQFTSLIFLRFLRLNMRMLRALRFLRVLRTLRFMRYSLGKVGKGGGGDLNVQRQVTEMVLTGLSIIFVTASLLQLLETDELGEARFKWHDAFYLTVVTISTVGYGDLAPLTLEGRLAVCVVIMVSVVIIPKQTSALINMVRSPKVYGKLPTAGARHLLVTGNGCMAHATISQFLRALYAVDNTAQGSSAPFVVLLHHHTLPREVKELLDERSFLDRVSFVRGSPLVVQDLVRARVASCEAVFVIGDPGCEEYHAEDATSLMTCLAVRSFCHDVPMVVQLLSANSLGDLNYTLDPSWPRVHAVNVVEIKNLILAKACVVDCFCAFLTNLLVPPDSYAVDNDGERQSDFGTAELERVVERRAESAYARSAASRLLLAAVPAALDGVPLYDLSLWARLKLNATLIAIKSSEHKYASRSLVLNPSVHREVNEGDILYLICGSTEAPARIMRITHEEWAAELSGLEDLLSHGGLARVWPEVSRLARRKGESGESGLQPASPVWRLLAEPSPSLEATASGSSRSPEGSFRAPRAAAGRQQPFGGALDWAFGLGPGEPAEPRNAYVDPESLDSLELSSSATRSARGVMHDALRWRGESAPPAIESLDPFVCAEWSDHVILSVGGGTLDWGGVAIFSHALKVASPSTKLLILSNRPEPQEWALVLRSGEGRHWMKGSYTAKGHLGRANVRAAKKLVVLVPPFSRRSADGRQADLHQADQNQVLAYLHLDAVFGSAANPALVELEYFENVRFLRPSSSMLAQPQAPPPSLARRVHELLGSAMGMPSRRRDASSGARAPSLALQASAPSEASASQLALPVEPRPEQAQRSGGTQVTGNNAYHPVFAAGRVFSMRTLDSLLNHAYLEPSIVDLIKKIALPAPEAIFDRVPQHARHHSCLTTLPLPEHLVGQTFGKLFERALLVHGVLCIALVSRVGRAKLHTKASMPSVITCPPVDRLLKKHDIVYVLTVSPAEQLDPDR